MPTAIKALFDWDATKRNEISLIKYLITKSLPKLLALLLALSFSKKHQPDYTFVKRIIEQNIGTKPCLLLESSWPYLISKTLQRDFLDFIVTNPI